MGTAPALSPLFYGAGIMQITEHIHAIKIPFQITVNPEIIST